MLKINNRRYIGSKAKLVEAIYQEASIRVNGNFSFSDLFAGTGVVAYEFASKGHPVLINDTLYSNYISYHAWFNTETVNTDLIKKIIENYNEVEYDSISDNYFSKVYSGKYYSQNDAKKIGYIREEIEKKKTSLNFREYCVLLTSLMYAADKVANTVGHFEHFLKKTPKDSYFQLRELQLDNFEETYIHREDANTLVEFINTDVVYIDPPYNARQYVNFYHVLENLITWEKPTEFEGTSMKFKRDHLKSGYSRVIAKELLRELIENINAKVIIVSYNNTYNARSTASNNRISEEDIIGMLELKGELDIVEIDHKYFNSGKTKFKGHKEKLYVCTVRGD